MKSTQSLKGWNKDNRFAYTDFPDTPEEVAKRDEAEIEARRKDELQQTRHNRKELVRIIKERQKEILTEALQVTESDLEVLHIEDDDRNGGQCCQRDNTVDTELEIAKNQLSFIQKAVSPLVFSYLLASAVAAIPLFKEDIRRSFYPTSPYHFLASGLGWIIVNILGRLCRNPCYILLMILLRTFALCNLLAAAELSVEYLIWEYIFFDANNLYTPDLIELEDKIHETYLRRSSKFQESWLDLPNTEATVGLKNRNDFVCPYFGALYALSCLFAVTAMEIRLQITRCQKNLTRRDVTGHKTQRWVFVAAFIPPLAYYAFVLSYPEFKAARSFDLTQITGALFGGIIFGSYISCYWESLFNGKSCISVRQKDYLYCGFLYSY